MQNESNPAWAFVYLMVAFVAYFLPTFIAGHRKHPNATPIFLIDLFLGWTFLGWLVALIWSASAIRKQVGPGQSSASESRGGNIQALERLAALREKGLLTDEEFQSEKSKLLG